MDDVALSFVCEDFNEEDGKDERILELDPIPNKSFIK